MKEEEVQLCSLALEKGLLSQEQVNEVLGSITFSGSTSLADLLVSQNLLTAEQIGQLRAELGGKGGAPAAAPAPDPDLERTVITAPPRETTTRVARSPSEPAPASGGPIGRYERRELLRKGSSADVWKAWDPVASRFVALKVLKEEGGGAEGVARFLREGQSAAKLDHPGIVKVFETGQAKDGGRDCAFIAMELVEGETLDKVRERGVTVQRAAETVRDAARAVACAHQSRVFHRDLKPRNIFVDAGGRVRVSDFGLAQLAGTLGPSDDVMLSRTIQVRGTPSYMSPEQALGRTSDIRERSDVYSLGATLYFLLTGRPPFDAGNPMKTCFAVVREPLVPPSKLNPDLRPDLERVVMRAMAKDPVRRYESAEALASDLERYATGAPVLSDDQLRFTQGVAALHAGRLEEAIHMFRELIRLEASGQDVVVGRDAVLKQLEEGEQGLTLAINQQQKNYDIRTNRGVYRFAKAIIRSLDGIDPSADCKNAMGDFVAAAELRPEHTPARVNRGNALIFGGRYARDSGKNVSGIFDMALRDLDAAIGFDDTCSPAYHNRGIVHFYLGREMKRDGDPEPCYRRAIADFSRAAELEPTYAYIFKDLGVVKVALAKHLLVKGDKVKSLFVEAVNHLDMAIELNGSIYGAYYSRGQARFALKDFKLAVKDFRRCLELDPARDVRKLNGLIEEAERHLKMRGAP
jgi:serine/threonine protein kinase